jgi:hypothetical protein
MSVWVFLSVGRTFHDRQEQFVTNMERFLEANGVVPRTVGRNYFSNQQPLKSVAELMRQCSGAVILALERTHIKEAVEKRGSPQEQPLQAINLPTVWNQIEAAMAYALDLPLFVVVENEIRSEGLLEVGYDWYVNWISLDQPVFSDPQFLGVFNDWKAHVLEHQRQKRRLEEVRQRAGEQPRDLMGEARSALLDCRLFDTKEELEALFVDSRIRPFRNRLLDGHSFNERVNMLISRLHNQHNSDGENALGLFLQVLSEHVAEGDMCKQRLANLAWQIELEQGQG